MKGVKLALSLNNITNNLKKLFSRINPFRNTGSSNLDNDQVLNRALGYAVNSLDYDAMVLLISAGANVNAIGSNGVSNIVYEYGRALARGRRLYQCKLESFSKSIEKNAV
ncbi:hypothetical protein [Wolbachia endosymbiont of Atemnus politus]|uniref:hypothetical protein n=1 Tax=Wolbachia endosymbiont of Atemnus politus TaxID=2682840 RepID=UPI001572FB30|nr:hypothetical protein [Wolbachia endosymbiont of Atemnus politus]